MNYASVQNLINVNDFNSAESILKNNPCNDSTWHYLYSKVLLSKQWFDESLKHLKIACELAFLDVADVIVMIIIEVDTDIEIVAALVVAVMIVVVIVILAAVI